MLIITKPISNRFVPEAQALVSVEQVADLDILHLLLHLLLPLLGGEGSPYQVKLHLRGIYLVDTFHVRHQILGFMELTVYYNNSKHHLHHSNLPK